VSGGLSFKVAAVLAAFAFAAAFRVEASRSDPNEPPAPVAGARTQAALASDVAPASGAKLPHLSRVAALPALRKAPVRHHVTKHRATTQPKAPVTTVATPTPQTTTASPPPSQPAAPKRKSYVGKSFDLDG
jgi:hypothetical protein